jgi:acetyl-CoA synthetase
MYEGTPTPPPGPLVGDHREVQGHDLLHRADRDPHLHEVGRRHPAKFDLSSLRLLGSVGEPINPEAWMWYRA